MPYLPSALSLLHFHGMGMPMGLYVSACAGLGAAGCAREASRLIRANSSLPKRDLRKATAALIAAVGVAPLIWTLAHVM